MNRRGFFGALVAAVAGGAAAKPACAGSPLKETPSFDPEAAQFDWYDQPSISFPCLDEGPVNEDWYILNGEIPPPNEHGWYRRVRGNFWNVPDSEGFEFMPWGSWPGDRLQLGYTPPTSPG